MYPILEKRLLAEGIWLMKVLAPRVARSAQPGQFVIVRADEHGERIPLTISDFDAAEGSVTIVTLPSAASKSEIVSGMRSPCSSARTMTNCPGCAERATRGARTFISQMPSARSLFSRMGYIISVVCLCVTLR